MNRLSKFCLTIVCACALAAATFAQKKQEIPAADVISKSIKAIGYEVGGGSTKVIFIGTSAAPNASGEAKVDAKKSGTEIDLKVKALPQPTTLGAEFLTYVLWTVTPDGTTTNLGEVPIDKNGEGKLSVTAQSQTFAMIVTAEPYFAVQLPSEVVVLENDTKKNTKGKIYPDNDYKLMKRTPVRQARQPPGIDAGPEEDSAGYVRSAQRRGHREIAKGRAIRAGDLHKGHQQPADGGKRAGFQFRQVQSDHRGSADHSIRRRRTCAFRGASGSRAHPEGKGCSCRRGCREGQG